MTQVRMCTGAGLIVREVSKINGWCNSTLFNQIQVQVNLCQKLLFLHQLTQGHNMTTDCSLNDKFNTWKFQSQTWGEHVVYRNCFWHSEQFLYTTCSPHVLQKEELLTKIYLSVFKSTLPKDTTHFSVIVSTLIWFFMFLAFHFESTITKIAL